jgi:hypothetical protein
VYGNDKCKQNLAGKSGGKGTFGEVSIKARIIMKRVSKKQRMCVYVL